MTEPKLIKDFIRTGKTSTSVEFYVRHISWEQGPDKPREIWYLVSRIEGSPDENQIRKETARILSDKRYFKRCKKCKGLNPVGLMHDAKTCQRCAQKNHEVSY